MPDTTVLPSVDIETSDPVADPGWMVVLYNDEIHTFEMVVYALQRAAGLSIEVAEMVAFEAHTEGEAVVKRGLERDDALIICAGLRKWTRIEGRTRGVDCEALKD